MTTHLDGKLISRTGAIEAFVDGQYVDWGNELRPTREEIVSVVMRRQAKNIERSGRDYLLRWQPSLTSKEITVIITLAREMESGTYGDGGDQNIFYQGILQGMRLLATNSTINMYEDLARRYNEFVAKNKED